MEGFDEDGLKGYLVGLLLFLIMLTIAGDFRREKPLATPEQDGLYMER